MKFAIMIFFAISITAQRIIDKPCPTPEILSDFDMDKYLGLWYEISRYENKDYETGCDCITQMYVKREDGEIFVRNCCMVSGNTTEYCAEGTAILTHANDVPTPGKLSLGFGESPKESNYWLLDTDYTHYSLVYHCNSIGRNKSLESAWIFARDRVLDKVTQKKIDDLVTKYIEKASLRIQNQKECAPTF